MTTRAEWIDEGLAVLAEQGLPGVRIDRIAARLGVSKGSFHHHFRGTAGYHAALLARYEERTSGALADALVDANASAGGARSEADGSARSEADGGATSEADGGATSEAEESAGEQTLRRLAERLPELYDPRVETAMRAWALHDDDARSVIGRVDAARLAALTAAWSGILGDAAAARTAALVPLLVAIGAAAAVPPLDLPELTRVYRLLADQVPAVRLLTRPGPAGDGRRANR